MPSASVPNLRSAAHIHVAVDRRSASGRGPGRQRVLDSELGVGEVRDRVVVVAVVEEAGAELVHDRRAEDVEVGQRERPLLVSCSSRSWRVSALPLASGSRLGWFEKKNFPLNLCDWRQLVIHVGRELMLIEGRRDDGDHLAALEQLAAAAVCS